MTWSPWFVKVTRKSENENENENYMNFVNGSLGLIIVKCTKYSISIRMELARERNGVVLKNIY